MAGSAWCLIYETRVPAVEPFSLRLPRSPRPQESSGPPDRYIQTFWEVITNAQMPGDEGARRAGSANVRSPDARVVRLD